MINPHVNYCINDSSYNPMPVPVPLQGRHGSLSPNRPRWARQPTEIRTPKKPKCSLHQDVARWKLKQNINNIRHISCEKVWDYKVYPIYLMVRSKQHMKTYLHKIPCLLKQSFPAVDVDDGINLEICAPLCSP